MLTIHWRRIKFYLGEFISSFIFGFIIFLTAICAKHNYSYFNLVLGSCIASTSTIVLIIALEDMCLVHFNPAYSFSEFILKRYLCQPFDFSILIFMIILQFLGFAVSAWVIKYIFCYCDMEVMRKILPRKILRGKMNLYLFELILSIMNSIVALRSRRRYIISPVIVGVMVAGTAVSSDTPTLKTFNPGTALGSKILFNSQENVIESIIAEFVGGAVGTFVYIVLFYGKYGPS